MVGKPLANTLVQKGYQVIILTRDSSGKQASAGISYASWDVKKQTIDVGAIQSADHIIHLAGAGVVEKKWTAAYRKEIVDSRVKSSALLISALKDYPNKVLSVISSSEIVASMVDNCPVSRFENLSTSLSKRCRISVSVDFCI